MYSCLLFLSCFGWVSCGYCARYIFHSHSLSLSISLLFSLLSCARFFIVASVGEPLSFSALSIYKSTPHSSLFLFSCVSFFFFPSRFLLIHLPTLPRSFSLSLSHIPSSSNSVFLFLFVPNITLFLSNSLSRSSFHNGRHTDRLCNTVFSLRL